MTDAPELALLITALITVVMAIPRVLGHKGNLYKALAHVWVGGLFGAWLGGAGTHYLNLGLAITAIEVLMFAAGRIRRS